VFTCIPSLVYLPVIFVDSMAMPVLCRLEWISIKGRDTTRLIYEILCLAEAGASRYRIMSRVSLNFSQAESYVSFLLDRGHLQLRPDSVGLKQYTLTPKGEHLRGCIASIQEELDGLFTRGPPAGVLWANRALSDLKHQNMDQHRTTIVTDPRSDEEVR